MTDFPPKGRYRHFKGNEYELLDFARHSETQEWMVVYRALYGEGGLWVRPLAMWQEAVERDVMDGRLDDKALGKRYAEQLREAIAALSDGLARVEGGIQDA